MPVKMIASRKTEIFRPRDASTRKPISFSALYTSSVAPEMKMKIDVMPAAPPLARRRPSAASCAEVAA
jgi:hypothetical protein